MENQLLFGPVQEPPAVGHWFEHAAPYSLRDPSARCVETRTIVRIDIRVNICIVICIDKY